MAHQKKIFSQKTVLTRKMTNEESIIELTMNAVDILRRKTKEGEVMNANTG